MQILVTGYPRSGTTYASLYFQKKGLDLPHERLGKSGVVSWFHILNKHPLSFNINFEPDFIIHLLRRPLDVISSAQTLSNISFNFLARQSGLTEKKSKLFVIMYSYLYWYEMIEKKAHLTVRVEDLKSYIPKVNERPHSFLTFDDLYKISPELTLKIKKIQDLHYPKLTS